jgi:predicted transcriptional regulator of viral defense system
METTMLKFKKVVLPYATLQEMKPGESIKISTKVVKTNILRNASSNLKKVGYLFRVSDRGLINETIVECIKKPEL